MFRTRTLVAIVVWVVLILSAIFVGIRLQLADTANSVALSPAQFNTAAVGDAVTIATDATRDNARASLLARIRDVWNGEPDPVVVAEPTPEEPATTGTPASPTERTLSMQRNDGTSVTLSVPRLPTPTNTHTPVTRTIVGVALEGTPLTNADTSIYAPLAGEHTLLGYALDGFGFYPETDATDLDACGGHTHAILWDGEMRIMYHYHINASSSAFLTCYKGTPESF